VGVDISVEVAGFDPTHGRLRRANNIAYAAVENKMPTERPQRERTDSDPEEDELVAFLSRPASYPANADAVVTIETHAARIFLTGNKAYKIKKRVKLPFLDFSSLEKRRRALQRELELNRPQAPEIYIGVVPIGRASDGTLSHDGRDTIIDYALEMNRFEQAGVLARVAENGPLPSGLCKALAEMVVSYHRSIPASVDASGADVMQNTIPQLVDEIADAKEIFNGEMIANFRDRSLLELKKRSSLLAERAKNGAIRRCHGDLHLSNIVLLSGRPVPFDALEFDERLATIDVLYDLSFLLMDLDFRGDRNAANIVLNSYVSAAPVGREIEGLAALPLFLAARAAVRAVVAVERARQLPATKNTNDALLALRYLTFANAYLSPQKPSLIAIGGLSGTGKSTLAASLAPLIGPAPGALHLRSDVERKRLFGIAEDQQLLPDHYTEAISEEIYRILLEKAERALAAGHAVVIDAVAAMPVERTAIASIAERAAYPFVGLWLEAPISTLVNRVEARHGDASDADVAVVRAQSQYNLGDVSWARIDASHTPAETLNEAIAELKETGLIG
jgi:aminoglycoside phosphotransferase family enzyme/predicted kinase